MFSESKMKTASSRICNSMVYAFPDFAFVISVYVTLSYCTPTFVVPFISRFYTWITMIVQTAILCFLLISAEEKSFLVSLSIPWLPLPLSPRSRYSRTILTKKMRLVSLSKENKDRKLKSFPQPADVRDINIQKTLILETLYYGN